MKPFCDPDFWHNKKSLFQSVKVRFFDKNDKKLAFLFQNNSAQKIRVRKIRILYSHILK